MKLTFGKINPNGNLKVDKICIDLKHPSCLQGVPEGECKGAGCLTDWVVSRDTGAEKNHVNQSQIFLPVLHLFQQNPVVHEHSDLS